MTLPLTIYVVKVWWTQVTKEMPMDGQVEIDHHLDWTFLLLNTNVLIEQFIYHPGWYSDC